MSELCTSPLALRVALYIYLRWYVVHCFVWVLPSLFVTSYVERSPRLHFERHPSTFPFYFTMPFPSRFHDTRVVHNGHRAVAHLASTRVGAWARGVIVRAAAEVVEQAHHLMANRAARCAPLYFHFCKPNVPQGDRGVCVFPERVPNRRHRQKHPPRPRRARACHLDLGRGPQIFADYVPRSGSL